MSECDLRSHHEEGNPCRISRSSLKRRSQSQGSVSREIKSTYSEVLALLEQHKLFQSPVGSKSEDCQLLIHSTTTTTTHKVFESPERSRSASEENKYHSSSDIVVRRITQNNHEKNNISGGAEDIIDAEYKKNLRWIDSIQFKAQYKHFRFNHYTDVIKSASSLDTVENTGNPEGRSSQELYEVS